MVVKNGLVIMDMGMFYNMYKLGCNDIDVTYGVYDGCHGLTCYHRVEFNGYEFTKRASMNGVEKMFKTPSLIIFVEADGTVWFNKRDF